MHFLFVFTFLSHFSNAQEIDLNELVDLPEINLKGVGRCNGKSFSCGKTIRNADVGKTMLVESPKYPSKVTCGVNCVIKIQTEPENQIVLRWKGFLIDGCHEGNKMRITDGDLQKSYCGDEMPLTFVSKSNVIEIAFSVVDMHREDRGVFYKFTYEATNPKQLKTRGTRRPTSRRPKQIVQQRSQQQPQQPSQQPQQKIQQQQQSNQKSDQEKTHEKKRANGARKVSDFTAYNYNTRYQSRDYEHSNNIRQQQQNQYDNAAQLEFMEELEELEKETLEESVNNAKPYVFMGLAVLLIVVSIALILKTIFCKGDSLHEDIKHFT